jgi:hypothetical protein
VDYYIKRPGIKLELGLIKGDKKCSELDLENLSLILGTYVFEIPYQYFTYNNYEGKCVFLFRDTDKEELFPYILG